jgi:O-acetyl-ADP-ribose deacetylase (regulator of RNase III)
MIKEIRQSVVAPKNGIVIHFCNCQGVMGAGLAKTIRNKWPVVDGDYKKYLEKFEKPKVFALGDIISTRVDDKLIVISCLTQYHRSTQTRQTDYAAVIKALNLCLSQCNALNIIDTPARGMLYDFRYDIYIPHNVGCGLGGGDWNIVRPIIDEIFANYEGNVFICRL